MTQDNELASLKIKRENQEPEEDTPVEADMLEEASESE